MNKLSYLQKIITQGFLNLKLMNKLVLIYSLVIIIPVTVVGYFSYKISESALVSEVTELVQRDLDTVSDHINTYIQSWVDKSYNICTSNIIIKKLANDYSGNITETTDLYEELDNLIKLIEQIQKTKTNLRQSHIAIYIKNSSLLKDDNEIFDINKFQPETDINDFLKNEKDLFWLPPTSILGYEPNSFESVLPLCKKIYSNNTGKCIGVIKINIPMSSITNEMIKLQPPRNGWCIFLDANRKCIYTNKPNTIDQLLINEIITQNKDRLILGQEIIFLKKMIANNGYVILAYPKEYLRQKVYGIFNVTWTIIIFSILGSFFVSYLAAHLITKRLVRFVESMHSMVKEEVPRQLQDTSNDEIGLLNVEFNQMVDKINMLLKERFMASLNKRVLELELLQYQVNPHFLYNVMSSIKWVSQSHGYNIIGEVVDSIVKFFRISLNEGNEILSIMSELEIIKEYINIQLFTFDDSFEVEYDIDPMVQGYFTIKLILQPIVENAILHGINEKEDCSGKIRITARTVDEDIYFDIEDNGTGMDEETILKLSEKSDKRKISKGYGLKNVQERIRLFFGDSYGILFKSKKGEGTKVTVKIPKCSRIQLEEKINKFL